MSFLLNWIPEIILEALPSFILKNLDLFGAATIAIFFLFIFFSRSYVSKSDKNILGMFDLDPKNVKVLFTDLGGRSDKLFLKYKGVTGVADAIFKRKGCRKIVVGEYKGRKYRGFIRIYEYYQVILYAGMVKAHFGRPVECLLAFDDKVMPFEFDEMLFNRLISLRKEAEFGNKNALPLHERFSINLPKNVRN